MNPKSGLSKNNKNKIKRFSAENCSFFQSLQYMYMAFNIIQAFSNTTSPKVYYAFVECSTGIHLDLIYRSKF